MADTVACLSNGKLTLIRAGHEPAELVSPYAEQIARRARTVAQTGGPRTLGRGEGPLACDAEPKLERARMVGVTRGRVHGELCYAISTGEASGVFAQKPGIGDEQRLFHGAGVELEDLDFSFGDEAFTSALAGTGGSSAIAVLADDGKGMRTVTEGDVIDRGPRWVPGGRGEIVYSSAGIGRTQAGAWAGRTPFSLHRLSLRDGTVEVLVSDAKYDYLAPVATSDALIYAIRRAYEAVRPSASLWGAIGDALLRPFRSQFAPVRRGSEQPTTAHAEHMAVWGNWLDLEPLAEDVASGAQTEPPATRGYELVRVTPQRTEVIISGVIAFDVAPNGDIVYSNGAALYRAAPVKGHPRRLVAQLERVEQIVVY